MDNDTDKIISAINDSTNRIESVLNDHEKRLRRLETTIAVQGWKIGAIVAVIMAFGTLTWQVAVDKVKMMVGIK